MLEPLIQPLLDDMRTALKGIDRVSVDGRTMLLELAATVLDRLNSLDDSKRSTFASHLRTLAANVEDHPAGAVAAALVDAAEAIRRTVALADAEPEGRA